MYYNSLESVEKNEEPKLKDGKKKPRKNEISSFGLIVIVFIIFIIFVVKIVLNDKVPAEEKAYKQAASFVEEDVLSASYIKIPKYNPKYVEKTNINEYSVKVKVTVQNIYCVENTYEYDVKVINEEGEFIIKTAKRSIKPIS